MKDFPDGFLALVTGNLAFSDSYICKAKEMLLGL